MNDQTFEAAMALFDKPKPVPSVGLYQLEQQRIHDNRDRLKAERLAREADRQCR
jgi:hypothetical protein